MLRPFLSPQHEGYVVCHAFTMGNARLTRRASPKLVLNGPYVSLLVVISSLTALAHQHRSRHRVLLGQSSDVSPSVFHPCAAPVPRVQSPTGLTTTTWLSTKAGVCRWGTVPISSQVNRRFAADGVPVIFRMHSLCPSQRGQTKLRPGPPPAALRRV
jgi:hypothetical protein